MTKPDVLTLFNECLSVIEHTKDDAAAERMLLIAFWLLQMADEIFAQRSQIEIVDRRSGRPGAARALASLRYGHCRSSAAPRSVTRENGE
jgi:hypothetical protein